MNDPINVGIKCMQGSSKIHCSFSFTNNAQEEYYLLRYNTPLEGLKSNFLSLKTQDGDVIPYKGILVKRLPPKRESFILLKPNESIQSPMIDLTEGYELLYDGLYTVQYNRPLVYISREDMDVMPDGKLSVWCSKHQKHAIKAVAGANFKVLSKKATKKTTFHDRPKFLSCVRDGCIFPQFIDGDEKQRAITRALHGELCSSNGYPKVISSLNQNGFLNKLWFGNTCIKSCHEVESVFQESLDGLTKNTVTYNFEGQSCTKEIIAYTKYGTDIVWLCPAFDSLPEKSSISGEDSKQQTLVHEWSHAYSNTKDHAYGLDACQELAKEDSYKAMNNADTFGYYFCDVFNA